MASTTKEKKFRRVTTGCLCCRKRKIKCDETKPHCQNCIKSGYLCEWSFKRESVQSMDNYKPIKTKKSGNIKFISHCHVYRAERDMNKNKNKNKNKKESEQSIDTGQPTVIETTGSSKQITVQENDVKNDLILKKYMQHINSRHFQSIQGIFSSSFKMSSIETHCLDAFINGFLVAVSPQLTHEKLQFSNIVIPTGINNYAQRRLFYAAGASFLSWQNREFRQSSELEYHSSMSAFHDIINSDETIGGKEDLVLVSFVIMTLRERYQCQNEIRNGLFLYASLKIIYYWIGIKERNLRKNKGPLVVDNEDGDEISSSQAALEDYYNQFILRDELNDIFDNLSHHTKTIRFRNISKVPDYTTSKIAIKDDIFSDFGDTAISVSAFERTIIESFLYNYCVGLLNFDPNLVPYVTSPFRVFEDLVPYLKTPIFDCPVKWMNNPIMGASLFAFELVAKANWLRYKYPLDSHNHEVAHTLQRHAQYYTSPFLPSETKFKLAKIIQCKLEESCHVGIMAAKASYILLTKLLNPELSSDFPDVQEELVTFFKSLHKVSLHSQAGGICLWQTLIAGLAVTDPEQREYLIYRVKTFGEIKKSEALVRVVHFLEFQWDNSMKGHAWDIMLQPKGFQGIFV